MILGSVRTTSNARLRELTLRARALIDRGDASGLGDFLAA